VETVAETGDEIVFTDRPRSAGATPTAAKSPSSLPKNVFLVERLLTGRQQIGNQLRIEGSTPWNVN